MATDFDLATAETLEQAFEKSKPMTMGLHETADVLALIRKCLRYEASSRPSTSQLLDDKWIKSIE